jgi:4-hydroxybenzoate polyprenyltransferase
MCEERPPVSRTARALRAYLQLIRYPLFAIPIAATLPGVVLAADAYGWNWRAVVAVGTALIGYFAGMIKNDYFHRATDAVANPTRPIPSGRVRPRDALRLASALYLICVALGFLMDWRAGGLVLVLIAISHAYNAYLKMRGIWGSLVLPLGIGLLSVFGAVSVCERVPRLVWFAFGAVFLYDFGTHIANTFKDIERDGRLGILTAPLQIGKGPALVLSTVATAAAFVVAAAPLALGERPGYAVWVVLALVTTVLTRAPLLRAQTERNGSLALKGAMVGAVVFFPAPMGAVLPFGLSAALILPLLATTLLLLQTARQEV